MIPAHLIFADINGHSNMPLETRAGVLRRFWSICEKHRPKLRHPGTSFYETDNDSLMAGFSGVEEMASELDVISWTLRLHEALSNVGVSASFGIGLATSPYTEEWKTIPGLLPSLKGHLYFPDDLLFDPKMIDRRRLMGNPLIVTARLLALAKKTNVTIAFGFFNDAQTWHDITHLQVELTNADLPSAFSLDDQLELLDPAQAHWMRSNDIQPYGITHTRPLVAPLPTFVRPDGWTTCPQCGWTFATYYSGSWSGYSHLRCGTYLALIPNEQNA